MKRREFIKLLGGASAGWPLAAHAQQAPPVLGFLHEGLPTHSSLTAAFQQGLITTGIAQVTNVKIENRWAEGQYDQLPRLARELVEQRVWVIVALYLVLRVAVLPCCWARAYAQSLISGLSIGEPGISESRADREDAPMFSVAHIRYFAQSLYNRIVVHDDGCFIVPDRWNGSM